jgi:4-amino-4-deoxy-L-arabinose transferase-like glycosyltransferase
MLLLPFKSLWLVPKILIGSLAVIDTFLIYKITERRYKSKTITFIASVLFAVMPVWWSLRVLFLESILLPLYFHRYYLQSISLYKTSKRSQSKKKNITLVLISGAPMGLAIFTKIPIFAFIPLVVYLQ